MLFLYFPKHLPHVGHAPINTGLINDWEVFTRPTVHAPINMELPFIFVGFDQNLPPALPNYRKNSVQSGKLVLWIHISFVGQWSSCMWHNICWHIVYSLFLFFFFCQKKTISIQVTSGEGWCGFSVTLGESFHHLQLQFPLLQFSTSKVGNSVVWGLLNASKNSSNRFVCMTMGRILRFHFIFCSGSNVNGWGQRC